MGSGDRHSRAAAGEYATASNRDQDAGQLSDAHAHSNPHPDPHGDGVANENTNANEDGNRHGARGHGLGMGTTTSNVNCRAAGRSSGTSFGVVSEGTVVTLRGAQQNGWTPVVCFGKNGWISSSYLAVIPTVPPTRTATVAGPSSTPTQTRAATTPCGSTTVTPTSVNCRATGASNGAVITVLAKSTTVPVRR